MPNVDERVVQMTFDNKQFEKGVSDSLKTLNDLKKALEFEDMKKSLSRLESATSVITDSLDGILESTKKVANVFTPLGNIGAKALERLSNKALDAGKSFASMITGMAGMKGGLDKYTTYTKSVQTITNATGKSIQEVEEVLNQLTEYTDLTSYDFAEMVSSIGKFTSVGIDLERSEKAMEGIANWAAKAGVDKQGANRAMYNISQAMGAGAMKKIDWKSIENANMATKEFKDLAIATAINMGVLKDAGNGVGVMLTQTKKGVKQSIVNYQNFAETLKDGWLTSEVMMQTLERYADRSDKLVGESAFEAAKVALTWGDAIDAVKDSVTSGWMRTFELLFGNLKEAGKVFTGICDSIIEFTDLFSTSRNAVLEEWHALGGLNSAMAIANNLWRTFMNVVYLIIDAWKNIFPPITGTRLAKITKQVKDATAALREMFGIDTETTITEPYEEQIDYAKKLSLNLKKGANPEEIYKLQDELKKAGYMSDKAIADGIYGKETEAAVKKLQKDLGVKVTGVWDEATSKATSAQGIFLRTEKLERERTVSNVKEIIKRRREEVDLTEQLSHNLTKGSKKNKDEIKLLQEQLIRKGYMSDKAIADGIYGKETEAAVKKLQEDLGVKVTGAWDDETRAAVSAKKMFTTLKLVEEKVYVQTNGITSASQKLRNVFSGLFAIVNIGKSIFGGIVKVVKSVVAKFKPLLDAVANAMSIFSNMFVMLDEDLKMSKAIPKTVDKIIGVFEPLGKVINAVADAINDFFAGYRIFILRSGKGFDRKRNTFATFFEYLKQRFSDNALFKALTKIYDSVKTVINSITGFFTNMYNTLFKKDEEAKKKSDKSGVLTFLNVLLTALTYVVQVIAMIFAGIAYVFSIIFDAFGKFISPIVDGIRSIVDSVKKAYEGGEIQSFTDVLKKLWEAFSVTGVGKEIAVIAKAIKGFFGSIVKYVKKNVPWLYNFATSLWSTLTSLFSFDSDVDVGETIATKFTSIKEKVVTSLNGFMEELRKVFPNVADFISGMFLKIRTLFSSEKLTEDGGFFVFDSGKTIVENVTDILKKIRIKIVGAFARFQIYLKKSFPNVYEAIKKFGEKIGTSFEKIKGFFTFDKDKSFLENIKRIFQEIGDYIKTKVAEIKGWFAGLFTVNEETGRLGIFDKLKELADWLLATKDKLIAAITDIFSSSEDTGDSAGGIFDTIREKLKSFADWVIGIKDKVVNAITSIFSAGKDEKEGILSNKGFTSVWDKIKEFWENLKKMNWGAIISTAITAIAGYGLFKGGEGIENISEVIKNTGLAGLIAGKGKEEEDNKGFFDSLLGKKGLGGTALQLAGAIGIIALVVKLLSTIDAKEAQGGVLVLLEVVGIIVAAVVAIKKATNKWGKDSSSKSDFGTQFMHMAIGIGVLVLALGGLILLIKNNMEDPKAMTWAAMSIVGMIAILAGISFLLNKSSKRIVTGEGGGFQLNAILQMCLGVAVLVFAFGKMVSIIKNNLGENGEGKNVLLNAGVMIGLMLAAVGAIALLLALITRKSTSGESSIGGILKICTGVAVLVLAFEKMVNIVKSNIGENGKGKWNLINAGIIIGAMLVVVGIIAAFVAGLSKNSISGESSISGILKLCEGIMVLVLAFDKLVNIVKNNSEQNVNKAFVILEVLLVTVGVIAVLMTAFSKNIEVKKQSLGIGLIAVMTYGLSYIAESFAKAIGSIKDVDSDKISKFMLGMIGAIAITGAFVAVVSKLPKLGVAAAEAFLYALVQIISGAIISFANSFSLLGERLKTFSGALDEVNWEGMQQALGYMQEILPGMVSAVLDSGSASDACDKMYYFWEMAISIELFADALSEIKPAARTGSKIAISLVMDAITISGLLALFKLPQEVAQGNLSRLGAHLGIYARLISAITEETLNHSKLAKKLVIEANIIAAIAKNFTMPSDIKNGNFSLLGGHLGLYAELIAVVTDETLKSSSRAMKLVMDANIIAGISKGFEMPVDINNGNLALLGGHLNNYSGLLTDLNTDKDQTAKTLVEDAKEIADSMNSIQVNDGEGGVEATLTALGAALSLYYREIAGIGKINPETGEALSKSEQFEFSATKIDSKMISDAFSALANAMPSSDEIDTLTSFQKDGDNDLISMSLGIEALGTALKGYGESIGTLNMENVTAANTALEGIKDIDTYLMYPNYEGITEGMSSASDNVKTHRRSISEFTGHIAVLGTALKGYAENIKDLDPENVKAANSALNGIKDIDTYLKKPNYGAIVKEMINVSDNSDDDNVSAFAGHIRVLGGALTDYVNSIKDISPTNIEAANSALTKFQGLDDYLRNAKLNEIAATIKNGLFDDNTFDRTSDVASNIAAFSADIDILAGSMENYISKIGNINVWKILAANLALDEFVKIQDHLIDKNSGKNLIDVVCQLVSGRTMTLHRFGNGITAIGQGMGKYISSIAGISKEKVEIANDTLDFFQNLENKIPKENGVLQWLGGSAATALGMLGQNLGTLGSGVAEYTTKIKDGTFDQKTKDSLDVVRAVAFLMRSLARDGSVETAGTVVVQTLEDFGNDLEKFGEKLMSFKDKINGLKMDQVEEAFAVIERVLSWTSYFNDAFVKDEGSGVIKSKADEIGNGLVIFMDTVADLVSKKYNKTGPLDLFGGITFTELFQQFGSGIITGISEGMKTAETESGILQSALSNVVLTALNNVTTTGLDEAAIENGSSFARSLLEVLVGDTDLAPTIRPVLELEDIEQGSARLQDLVNPNGTLAIRAVLSTESAQAIAGSIVSVKDTIRSSMDDLLAKMDQRDTMYENKLNAVVNRVAGIKNEIGNMKVVLDKSRVVGGIINDIDRKLGDRWFDAGRVSGRF